MSPVLSCLTLHPAATRRNPTPAARPSSKQATHPPRGHVWLPLGGDDDAGIGVVEAVLCQAHEGRILLHKQDEHGVALDAVNLSKAGRQESRRKRVRRDDGAHQLDVAQGSERHYVHGIACNAVNPRQSRKAGEWESRKAGHAGQAGWEEMGGH
jgi:hypothetical protein